MPGKDGAEAEAIDVLFAIDGMERPVSYRLFLLPKLFVKTVLKSLIPKYLNFKGCERSQFLCDPYTALFCRYRGH